MTIQEAIEQALACGLTKEQILRIGKGSGNSV